ncbi:MAG: HesB-like protein [Clostridium sp.]
MKKITISTEAYNEFKSFLDENGIEKYDIRINLAGFGCSGPAFNISVSESTDEDVVETVEAVNFIMEKSLVEEFGGFIILSTEENEGRGLTLKPVIAPEGGCGSCGGGCGH